MAPDQHLQHITVGRTQAEVFVTTKDHSAALHITRGIADDITLDELDKLIEALTRAKAQIKAFQLARINAARASLLLAA